ncbi:6-bladed beta-propeller [Parabacteroides sp. OttesenSCG-928-G07]|nr:6-bladed beta-propeller [Parabacteroides sp. OttesenSCG-928-G21]MDL2277638.1 6-bladed beta-propeller [Parabacteroides sp. OttesenSCG-928-G07]
MKNCWTISFFVILFACGEKPSEFLVLPVDISQNYPVSLSEITEELKSIELEMTDESLISSIHRVLDCGDYLLISNAWPMKIMLFNKEGKFIHTISSQGQGPGEYSFLREIAADPENKRIYIAADMKLMCYDFDNRFIKEVLLPRSIEYMVYNNNELIYVITSRQENESEGGIHYQAMLYKADKDFHIKDSMEVKNFLLDKTNNRTTSINSYLSCTGKNTYMYYPVGARETFLRDTLYKFGNDHFIPDLRLKFSDEEVYNENGVMTRFIYTIYRSSRYVFARHRTREKGPFYYWYDMKTGEGYNMEKGFRDDIYTGEIVPIYSFAPDSEKFYYYYTKINDVDKDEPNPTLYIGELKK